MENFIYDNYRHYFDVLQKTGYYAYKDVYKLLILDFIYRLIYDDYRGYVRKEDYKVFEKAFECLYGTSCLIPYPDYLKMGKLKLGEMTELLCRCKESSSSELEERVSENEQQIAVINEKLTEQEARIADNENDHATLIISDTAPDIETV